MLFSGGEVSIKHLTSLFDDRGQPRNKSMNPQPIYGEFREPDRDIGASFSQVILNKIIKVGKLLTAR